MALTPPPRMPELRQGVSFSTIGASAERANRLLGSRYGLVSGVFEQTAGMGCPSLFGHRALMSHTVVWAPHVLAFNGSSCHFDRSASRIAAVMECAERYSAGVLDQRSSLIRGCRRELGTVALDPREYPLGSGAEYRNPHCKYRPFEDEQTYDWDWVHTVATGEAALLPAAMIYMPYRVADPKERLMPQTSNGCAIGCSREEALLAATLELIERDAFFICWWNRLEMPTLRIDEYDESGLFGRVVSHWSKVGFELVFKRLETNLPVPVVLGMAINDRRSDLPALMVSAAASTSMVRAVRKAICELEQGLRFFAERPRPLRPYVAGTGEPFPPVEDQEGHLDLFYDRSMLRYVNFLKKDRQPITQLSDVSVLNVSQQVAQYSSMLAEAGFALRFADLTSPDVKEAGLYVVRALALGLQPFSFGHAFRHLGGERLYEVPVKMGLRQRKTREQELNATPHPFP